MNGTIKVVGGKKLSGQVTPIPNKNSILKVLPAAILTSGEITYNNFPKTTDVEKLLTILKELGAKVDDSDYNHIKVSCEKINKYEVTSKVAGQFRSSILFVGPLLARFGKARIPLPGGCVLGFRSIAAHVDVFKKVGVKVELGEDYAEFTAPKNPKKQNVVWQLEASVTATENFAMYAAGCESEFTLHNAASEPHVTKLLMFLEELGAEVDGIGSNKITIRGRKNMTNGTEFTPRPDFVDIAGYITAAAVTKGTITIKGANIPDITDNLINHFSLFNIGFKKSGQDIIVDGTRPLKIDYTNSGIPLAGPNLPKIKPAPWPGLQVDILPVFVTLACKTKGRLLLQNWMYETGLDFISELNKMGADIFMCDPQRVIITGPVKFKGGEVVAPGIIQACKAIFLASLADEATTILHGVDVLKRRYPDIIDTYKKLGANIEAI